MIPTHRLGGCFANIASTKQRYDSKKEFGVVFVHSDSLCSWRGEFVSRITDSRCVASLGFRFKVAVDFSNAC